MSSGFQMTESQLSLDSQLQKEANQLITAEALSFLLGSFLAGFFVSDQTSVIRNKNKKEIDMDDITVGCAHQVAFYYHLCDNWKIQTGLDSEKKSSNCRDQYSQKLAIPRHPSYYQRNQSSKSTDTFCRISILV
jgi:hypothetical protein